MSWKVLSYSNLEPIPEEDEEFCDNVDDVYMEAGGEEPNVFDKSHFAVLPSTSEREAEEGPKDKNLNAIANMPNVKKKCIIGQGRKFMVKCWEHRRNNASAYKSRKNIDAV